MGCHLWGRTESDTTEATQQQQQQQQGRIVSLTDQSNMDARFSKAMMAGNMRMGGEYDSH